MKAHRAIKTGAKGCPLSFTFFSLASFRHVCQFVQHPVSLHSGPAGGRAGQRLGAGRWPRGRSGALPAAAISPDKLRGEMQVIPAQSAQSGLLPRVAGDIAGELAIPIVSMRCRSRGGGTAGMLMPKAAMYK